MKVFNFCLRPVVVYGVSESWHRPPSLSKPNLSKPLFYKLRQVGGWNCGNLVGGLSYLSKVCLRFQEW